MKVVIVFDVHANLAALEALPERDFDQLWCLGDLVDYGPRPHEVVQRVQHKRCNCSSWQPRSCSWVLH